MQFKRPNTASHTEWQYRSIAGDFLTPQGVQYEWCCSEDNGLNILIKFVGNKHVCRRCAHVTARYVTCAQTQVDGTVWTTIRHTLHSQLFPPFLKSRNVGSTVCRPFVIYWCAKAFWEGRTKCNNSLKGILRKAFSSLCAASA